MGGASAAEAPSAPGEAVGQLPGTAGKVAEIIQSRYFSGLFLAGNWMGSMTVTMGWGDIVISFIVSVIGGFMVIAVLKWSPTFFDKSVVWIAGRWSLTKSLLLKRLQRYEVEYKNLLQDPAKFQARSMYFLASILLSGFIWLSLSIATIIIYVEMLIHETAPNVFVEIGYQLLEKWSYVIILYANIVTGFLVLYVNYLIRRFRLFVQPDKTLQYLSFLISRLS